LKYPDAYLFARQLIQPGIFSGGRLDGPALTARIPELEPKPAHDREKELMENDIFSELAIPQLPPNDLERNRRC